MKTSSNTAIPENHDEEKDTFCSFHPGHIVLSFQNGSLDSLYERLIPICPAYNFSN